MTSAHPSTAHAHYRRGTPCCRLLNKIRYCRRCSAQARWCRGSRAAHGRQNRAAGTLGGVGAAGTAQKRHETGRKCTSGHCYGGRTPLRCVPPLTCMQRSNGKPRFPQCPGTWRCRRAARVGTGGAHTCIRACRQRKALGAPYGAPQPPWEPPGAAQGCACPAARGAGNPVGSPRECYGVLQGHRGSLGNLTRTLGRLWGTLRDRRTPTNLSALQQNEWKSNGLQRQSETRADCSKPLILLYLLLLLLGDKASLCRLCNSHKDVSFHHCTATPQNLSFFSPYL